MKTEKHAFLLESKKKKHTWLYFFASERKYKTYFIPRRSYPLGLSTAGNVPAFLHSDRLLEVLAEVIVD